MLSLRCMLDHRVDSPVGRVNAGQYAEDLSHFPEIQSTDICASINGSAL